MKYIKSKQPKDYGLLFKMIQFVSRPFLTKYKWRTETVPDLSKPTVFIAHHENLRGPIRIMSQAYIFVRVWVFSNLVDFEECYQHFLNYTFTRRYQLPRWLVRIFVWIPAKITSAVLRSMRSIPVYRGSRTIRETINMSIDTLKNGIPILISPDINYSSETQTVGPIYEGFLNLQLFYQRHHSIPIQFVPVYASPTSGYIRCGRPVEFDLTKKFRVQRKAIAKNIVDELNHIIAVENNQVQL